jgi:hypothetical protein
MAENSRDAKFPRWTHTLQRNKSPHGKEHLLHTQSSDKSDIE